MADFGIGLLDFYAPQKLLRENMAFKNAWWYYGAMIIDPILRFNWIFYVIVPGQLQTSALLSFCVAFSEVCRRGIWTIFRVENEHCTNVERFRASRDVPLPYDFKQPEAIAEEGGLPAPLGMEQEADEAVLEEQRRQGIRPSPSGLTGISSRTSGNDVYPVHSGHSAASSTVRRRSKKMEQSPLIRRVGSILHMAHAQDFERKKRPEAGREEVSKSSDSEDGDEDYESSDDVEEEAERVVDEEMARDTVDGPAAVDGMDERELERGPSDDDNGKMSEVDESGEMSKEEIGEEVEWNGGERHEDGGEMSSGMQSPGGHSPPK